MNGSEKLGQVDAQAVNPGEMQVDPDNLSEIAKIAAKFIEGKQLSEEEMNMLMQVYEPADLCAMAYAADRQEACTDSNQVSGISDVHPKGILGTVE